jgi:hypothetical protein
MSKLGPRLLKAVEEAIAGNLSRITIEGQTWVRLDDDHVIVQKGDLKYFADRLNYLAGVLK